MNFADYQKDAMRTASLKNRENEKALTNAALGLCGEAGEFADSMKKHIFQGHELDKAHLAEEIGDVLWYCALAAEGLGISLDEIAENNIAKLRRRYPQGFEVSRSVDRTE